MPMHRWRLFSLLYRGAVEDSRVNRGCQWPWHGRTGLVEGQPASKEA